MKKITLLCILLLLSNNLHSFALIDPAIQQGILTFSITAVAGGGLLASVAAVYEYRYHLRQVVSRPINAINRLITARAAARAHPYQRVLLGAPDVAIEIRPLLAPDEADESGQESSSEDEQ